MEYKCLVNKCKVHVFNRNSSNFWNINWGGCYNKNMENDYMDIQLCDSGYIFNYLAGYLSWINSECTVVLIQKPAYSHCIQYGHRYIYIICFSLLVLSLKLFKKSCLSSWPSSRQVRHNQCSIWVLPASSIINLQ